MEYSNVIENWNLFAEAVEKNGGEGHGVEMARNFKEFVFLSSRLGCVGAEDWQWLPFIEKDTPFINPDCENSIKFREALDVKA
jgi:hypothetical protein